MKVTCLVPRYSTAALCAGPNFGYISVSITDFEGWVVSGWMAALLDWPSFTIGYKPRVLIRGIALLGVSMKSGTRRVENSTPQIYFGRALQSRTYTDFHTFTTKVSVLICPFWMAGNIGNWLNFIGIYESLTEKLLEVACDNDEVEDKS